MPIKERCLCVKGADADMIFPNDDNIMRFDYRTDYGVVLVKAGVFASIKEAWEKKFKGQVPTGWTDELINCTRVYIYNPSETHWGANDVPWHEDEGELARALACGDEVWADDVDEEGNYGIELYGYPFTGGYRGWNSGS